MNVQQIITYLQDLIDDILRNGNRPEYIAHKVWVLIDKLQEAKKEEEIFDQITL